MAEMKMANLDRRDLIKKGAIATGAAWAAPMVFSTVAGAQSQTCYFVKRDAGTGNCNGSDPSGSCPPVAGTISGCGTTLFTLSVTEEGASATVADGCTLTHIQVKAGNACNSIAASGQSASVTRSDAPDGKEISHVNIAFCCADGSTP